ncbi:MAG: sialate O-acetylesterase [Planctomycetota bacterium]|nr:sialate O-acetylesterase [Planctomycetota bacterium]
MRYLLFLLLALGLLAEPAQAEVTVAGIFGDHMVLQRDKPIHVWGTADPGESVTVKLAGRSASTTADADGRWRVELEPLKAGGPFKLHVRGTNKLTFKDVLVGEVWLCSGQSNMEWSVARSADAKQEIAAAKDSKIRHIKIPRRTAGAPMSDVTASWEVCSRKTVGRFTACGYYMARELRKKLRVPVGLVNASWGGTRIEPWIPPDDLDAEGPPPANPQQPSVLYNGMVHAAVGYTMRGAIWYQGESNHTEGSAYTDKMKALIDGWRALWGIGAFPFYFVQIAPFRYGNSDPSILPTFWEAQAAVLDVVPETGMVVTNDIATLDDIHPPNKQDVGERLALLALNRTYGESVVDTGPTFKELVVEATRLRVVFDDTGGRLNTRDRKAPSHFEIAGMAGRFLPAEAKIDGDSILLWSDDVKRPTAMRFAWHKLAQPNLVNAAGLPAGAFRAGELIKPDVLRGGPIETGYTLVYDLDLAKLAAEPRYDADRTAKIDGAFDRVAYLLELRSNDGVSQYIWVSMDAFTDDVKRLGVPSVATGVSLQQSVSGVNVITNVKGVEGAHRTDGHIEFWPNNYGPANGAEVPGASAKIWDFGDQPGQPVAGYGCMQVHIPSRKQTVFAVNHWRAGGAADIGIGNSALDPRTTDWTFARNAMGYNHKRLRVFVRLK